MVIEMFKLLRYQLGNKIFETDLRPRKEKIIEELKPKEGDIITETIIIIKKRVPQGKSKMSEHELMRSRKFKFIKGRLLKI